MHTSSQPTIQTKHAVYQCPCPQCHWGTLMISRIEPDGPGMNCVPSNALSAGTKRSCA